MYSVEVYIPWNDTWLDLPLLPDQGVVQFGRMSSTNMMYLLESGGGGSYLYLLGGSSNAWSIGEASSTSEVWRLMWDSNSQTYSWTSTVAPELGE